VVVVTGRDAELLAPLLGALPVRVVYNAGFAQGLTGSIQKGVQAAAGNGYMICLADMVLLEPGEYALLEQQFRLYREANQRAICLPVYEEQKGNPVIFADSYKAAIAAHKALKGAGK